MSSTSVDSGVLGPQVSEDEDGIRPSPNHLEAIDRIAYPHNAKETQRLLGLFNYFRLHSKDFSRRMAPVQPYTSRTGSWQNMDQAAIEAIDDFKEEMKRAPLLVPFDPSRQLWIDTDASAEGMGFVVYHVSDTGARHPIGYYSKKFSKSERAWSPYVREAYCVYWALTTVKLMVECTLQPVKVLVDQRSLQWMKKARSPVVVRWMLQLQELRFYVTYRPGKDNFAADAFSRVPCIEPGVPSELGEVIAIQKLLDHAKLTTASTTNKQWVWLSLMGEHPELAAQVRTSYRRVTKGSPTNRVMSQPWSHAIVASKLFLTGKTFAVLMPTDMVHLVYCPDGTGEEIPVNEDVKKRVLACPKLVFLESGLVWLVSDWPGVQASEVFAAQLGRPAAEHSPGAEDRVSPPLRALTTLAQARSAGSASETKSLAEPHASVTERVAESFQSEALSRIPVGARRRLRGPPTRKELVELQSKDKTAQEWDTLMEEGTVDVDGGTVFIHKGLWRFQLDSQPRQKAQDSPFYLPSARREETVMWLHRDREHARGDRLSDYLARTYWWPSLRADVKRWLNECHFCAINRARKVWKHKKWSSMKIKGPHEAYGIDVWYPTVISAEGYVFLLTIVDLFHGYVRFKPLFTKSAPEIISVFYNEIVCHLGLPKFILSDQDPAFRGKLSEEFKKVTGMGWLHTAAYSAWELGRVERRHDGCNRCMKEMPDTTLWARSLPGAAARAWNTLKSTVTGVTPAEVEYGHQPLGPLAYSLQVPEDGQVPEERKVKRRKLFHHLTALKEACRVFEVIVDANSTHQRALSIAKKKRQSKRAVPEIKVGMKVSVLRPTKKRDRTKKELEQWSGPWIVTKIAHQHYHCTKGSQKCAVSRPFINEYKKKTPLSSMDVGQVIEIVTTELKEQQLVAVGDHRHDEPGNRRFHLARFQHLLPNEECFVHYLGTQASKQPYRFLPIWIDNKDQRPIPSVKKPKGKGISKDVSPWSGKEPLADILPVEIKLTKGGGFTAVTLKQLKELGDWKPHIMS
jgi:hypothetical protein